MAKKNREAKKEVVKDKRYYEQRRQDGIRNITAKKTPYQRRRTFERMMAKLDVEKPMIDDAIGVVWGTDKNNAKNKEAK